MVKQNKMIVSMIEFITLEVVKQITQEKKIAYDDALRLFQSSLTYQMLPNMLLNTNQIENTSSYSSIAKIILTMFWQEQQLSVSWDNFFKARTFNLEKKEEIQKIALSQHLSLEEAFQNWENSKKGFSLVKKK